MFTRPHKIFLVWPWNHDRSNWKPILSLIVCRIKKIPIQLKTNLNIYSMPYKKSRRHFSHLLCRINPICVPVTSRELIIYNDVGNCILTLYRWWIVLKTKWVIPGVINKAMIACLILLCMCLAQWNIDSQGDDDTWLRDARWGHNWSNEPLFADRVVSRDGWSRLKGFCAPQSTIQSSPLWCHTNKIMCQIS